MKKNNRNIRLFPKLTFYKLISIVVVVHLIFLLILAVKGRGQKKMTPKPLVVRNFVEKKPKPLQPKSKPIQTAKKVVKKALPKQNQAPPKKVNKEITDQTLSLLKKLEEEISSIKTSPSPLQQKDTCQLPKEIKEIKSQAKIEVETPDESQQRLVQELQHQLHLPEFGEVKCSFSIDEKGAIGVLEFVSFKSKKNMEYLKKTLPELTFPWFNLQSAKERQFLITFSNETEKL